MKNAVMYGAGNIGRGFIGQALSESGYRVTFIDVNENVVNLLKKEGRYPVRLFNDDKVYDRFVENVTAVNGNDIDSVVRAIAEADLMATAVGVNVLKYVAKPIALGLIRRWENGVNTPLDIIICENLIDADKCLSGLIAEHMDGSQRAKMAEMIGFVKASIGRMVPIQTEQMQDGNPLRVCTEEYSKLPVDKAAFKGPIPDIMGLIPYSPFDYFICRIIPDSIFSIWHSSSQKAMLLPLNIQPLQTVK